MNKTFYIRSITREMVTGDTETLQFSKGLNILEGRPNTGKTAWLNMIDFLLGDVSTPEEALASLELKDMTIADKYCAIYADIVIDNESINIARKWRENGLRSKIIVNGEPINAKEFSNYFLSKLNIPLLHFPKGNPYSEKTWPELSWRIILRHMYRQERFWSDLADRQPETEQFAALAQLLGFADKIFSQGLSKIINDRKELIKLEARKEQFQNLLDSLIQKLSSTNMTFATKESLEEKLREISNRLSENLDARQEVIRRANDTINSENEPKKMHNLSLAKRKAELLSQIEVGLAKKNKLKVRIENYSELMQRIQDEIGRLMKADISTEIFSTLRITHCPACNQGLDSNIKNEQTCELCNRPIIVSNDSSRISFEIDKLSYEADEAKEVFGKYNNELEEIENQEQRLRAEIKEIENTLLPIKNDIAALVNDELQSLDTERGRLHEQNEIYSSLLKSLEEKDALVKQIDAVQEQIKLAESELDSRDESIPFETISCDLEEKMLCYLNAINKNHPERWQLGRVKFNISENRFGFRVNNTKWTAIGATLKDYFLFAYHYGLLALTGINGYNYPGFLIIDFPPDLADSPVGEGRLDYLVEPFANLCKTLSIDTQVIISGRSFSNLKDVNIIKLDKVWV